MTLRWLGKPTYNPPGVVPVLKSVHIVSSEIFPPPAEQSLKVHADKRVNI